MKTKPHLAPSEEYAYGPKDESKRSPPDLKVIRELDPRAFDVVSVDLFDTLLIRKPFSERRRQFKAAQHFLELAAEIDSGLSVCATDVWRARRSVQQAAYKAQGIDKTGEVQLTDILQRALQMLDLDNGLMPLMVQAELDVEMQSVFANQNLVKELRSLHAKGMRIIAISDTPLASVILRELVDRVVGSDVIDKIYSSADENATKRDGSLFPHVLESEGVSAARVFHVGDDLQADEKMAMESGISTLRVDQSLFQTYRRKLDGVQFEAQRLIWNAIRTRARSNGTAVQGTGVPAENRLGKKIKIALNGKFLTAPVTGVHRVAEELILALDRLIASNSELSAKFDVVILAPPTAKRSLPTLFIPTKTVGFLQTYYWEQFDLPRHVGDRLLINLCNLGPFLRRRAITMIHDAQVFTTPESYAFMFRSLYRLVLPIIGLQHRRILTVSNFSKEELSRYRVAAGGKILVIYNGADHIDRGPTNHSATSKFGLAKDRYVLALANVQRHKNIQVLLDAFRRPDMAGLQLVLYGAAQRGDFEDIGIDVPSNVVFTGRIDDADLNGLLENALCLAFPSLTEGFGLPPLEAMRLGCPVVAAPCGALPEVCGDAVLYANPNVSDEWVAAIGDLQAQPGKRQKLASAGKVRSHAFSWDSGARQLLEIVEELSS